VSSRRFNWDLKGFIRFSPQKYDGKLGEMKGKPMDYLGENPMESEGQTLL